MGQLVVVQHKRGAQGGLVFAKALNLDLSLGDTSSEVSEVNNVLPELHIPPRSTAMIPPGHVRYVLQLGAIVFFNMFHYFMMSFERIF